MRSQVAAFQAHELHAPGSEPELGDLRFRALMSEADWLALPLSIRRRFSKRLAGGRTVVYVGETLTNEMSRAGWLLAQVARLIGGPLPLVRDAHAPSVVTVTEDVAARGQHWTPVFREGHAPMQEGFALVFRAAHYFMQLGAWRIRLPRWASPGSLSVTHAELGDGRFLFKLDIIHPRLGRLICQTAAFQEAQP